MNEQQRASAQRILDHFLPDEERHFEENGQPDNHIYSDLLKLQEFLQRPQADVIAAAQELVDDADDTGCEQCSVVSETALLNLEGALERYKANV